MRATVVSISNGLGWGENPINEKFVGKLDNRNKNIPSGITQGSLGVKLENGDLKNIPIENVPENSRCIGATFTLAQE